MTQLVIISQCEVSNQFISKTRNAKQLVLVSSGSNSVSGQKCHFGDCQSAGHAFTLKTLEKNSGANDHAPAGVFASRSNHAVQYQAY